MIFPLSGSSVTTESNVDAFSNLKFYSLNMARKEESEEHQIS